MGIKKIGARGLLITFYDLGIPTNVYVIWGNKYTYIVDTYLGPDSMGKVHQFIKEHTNTPIIIINSHSHWDHVWGNCFFSSSLIIGHKKCKEYMERDGRKELQENAEYQRGEIKITYPNLTFTDKLYFEEDNILIYYTPGHTDDSISVLDIEDKVLFAGDNLERPIPYLESKNLTQYVHTLEAYLDRDVEFVIGGHTGCEDKSLIVHNLNYVKKVLYGENIIIESKEFEEYHAVNLKWLNQSTKKSAMEE